MWGISGGEGMTLRAIYDSDAPLAGDFSTPETFSALYEHALPLDSPLGMEVSFGPYAAKLGSGGVAANAYAIDVFDVIIPYPNFPDLSEAISINIQVAPFSLSLPGPAGFHDLDMRGISLGFRNFYGRDFLNGSSLPAGFPDFDWEDVLLTVDVYDPIYDRNGSAFLQIDSLTLSTLPPVPTLPVAGFVLLAVILMVTAVRFLRKMQNP
jgi:hypothetical protein